MSPTVTEEDVGKRVESADGDEIGVITAIDRETAYVDPEPGMINTIKAVFDWEGSADEAVPLADDAVKQITDDAIHLETAAPAKSITTEADADADADEDADLRATEPESDSDEPAADYSPGEPVESTVAEPEASGDESALGTGVDDLDGPIPDVDTDAAGRSEDVEDQPVETRHTAEEAEPAQELDPMGEIDDTSEIDPDREDPLEETGGIDDVERAAELDEIEDEASREVEVDPSEVTNDDPEADVRPDEDVGQRTESEPDVDTTAGVDSESERPTTDGEESVATETGTKDADDADDASNADRDEDDR